MSRQIYPGICAVCGKDFLGRHPDQKTCGKECGYAFSVQRRRERHGDARTRTERKYQANVDEAVKEAVATWSGDPFAATNDMIYGNMVTL